MASESVHLDLANRNQATIDYLCLEARTHAPWIVTVAFYKALHVVEAVFANDHAVLHTSDHGSRLATLKGQRKYEHIYRRYKKLQHASNVARYLEGADMFEDYLSTEDVQAVFLFDHLKQIENSARRHLTHPEDLVSVDSAKAAARRD